MPTETTTAGMGRNAYVNPQRFPVFYRTGSGTQYIRDADWKVTFKDYPYEYLIGGTVGQPYQSADQLRMYAGYIFDLNNGPLASYSAQGDSGSPLYAWDTTVNQWVLIGVLQGGFGQNAKPNDNFSNISNFMVYDAAFQQARYNEDQAPDIENSGNLIWSTTDNKVSQLTQSADKSWSLHLKDSSLADNNVAMNAGKNINFNGSGGDILLKNSINQGAGGLTFNNSYTVKAENNQSWQGAGIIVAKDKTVNWQVNGVENDFLHKLGAGTLHINAEGKNTGSLSAGDGITILNQQADTEGNLQAFDKVRIASGRPIVVLNDEKQVNPNNIYFGFRGGRLDLNGNQLTFEKIHNVDNGAQIVNHNAKKAANINIVGDSNVVYHTWSSSQSGTPGSLYKHVDRRGRTEYWRLKSTVYGSFSTSSPYWEFLGYDEAKAKDIYITSKNISMFQGVLGETSSTKTNGTLNFNYHAPTAGSIYTLSGGSDLNGEISVTNGTLLLSGNPTPHASAHHPKPASDVIIDNDWIIRDFKAKTFKATSGATLQLGNYANLSGDIVAESNSQVSLGYSKGENGWDNSWKCTRSDSNGIVSCNQTALSETLYNELPTAQVNGNITLAENAKLNLGKTQYQGSIQAATNSATHLMKDALWTLSGDSTLGNLSNATGSTIKLNGDSANGNFHTLTINGNLSGDGRFELNSSLADFKSDRVIVNGLASGNYLLALQDSGKEPNKNIRVC